MSDLSPEVIIAGIEHKTRRADSEILLELFTKITGVKPRMWGKIIGFGQYHYTYESGREGDSFRLGFAPRKTNIVIHIMPGYQDFEDELSRLGKHKMTVSCLYINKLADIDLAVLEEIAAKGWANMARLYPE